MRQIMPTTSTSSSATKALEQQVRAHPVVQEVMHLFDARIVAITWSRANEDNRHLAIGQQLLGFSSPEVEGKMLTV